MNLIEMDIALKVLERELKDREKVVEDWDNPSTTRSNYSYISSQTGSYSAEVEFELVRREDEWKESEDYKNYSDYNYEIALLQVKINKLKIKMYEYVTNNFTFLNEKEEDNN